MRKGNRDHILEAARRVIQTSGVTGLTFDAVAEESSVTRPGVMYHFPSRRRLVLAMHHYLAELFESRLMQNLDAPYDAASSEQRLRAYILTCAAVTSRAELLFMLEAALDEQASQIWTELYSRWVPSASAMHDDEAGMFRFLLRLAADGLWLYEAATGESLTSLERDSVASALETQLGSLPR